MVGDGGRWWEVVVGGGRWWEVAYRASTGWTSMAEVAFVSMTRDASSMLPSASTISTCMHGRSWGDHREMELDGSFREEDEVRRMHGRRTEARCMHGRRAEVRCMHGRRTEVRCMHGRRAWGQMHARRGMAGGGGRRR